jgi:hypothetical protein
VRAPTTSPPMPTSPVSPGRSWADATTGAGGSAGNFDVALAARRAGAHHGSTRAELTRVARAGLG